MRCPICAGDGVSRPTSAEVAVWQCADCDLVFRAACDAAPASLFGEAYFRGAEPDGYRDYEGEERAHRLNARSYLRAIRRACPGAHRLYDAGCATGVLLDEARRRGWEVAGCDPSPFAASLARERFGLSVLTGEFGVPEPGVAPVDALTLINVLEHCADPRQVARRCEGLVRPGGILLIETWDRQSLVARLAGRRWHQWSPRRVAAWYDRRSLLRLFPADRWEWLRYGMAVKWITLARGIEILGAPSLSALRSFPLPYVLGDLIRVVLRRARRVRSRAGIDVYDVTR